MLGFTDVPLGTLVVRELSLDSRVREGLARSWRPGGGMLGAPAPASPPPCSVAVKCSVCKSVSDTYDPYLDVALEIRVWTAAPLGRVCLRLRRLGRSGESVRAHDLGR